jgi:hypothetical protein
MAVGVPLGRASSPAVTAWTWTVGSRHHTQNKSMLLQGSTQHAILLDQPHAKTHREMEGALLLCPMTLRGAALGALAEFGDRPPAPELLSI